MSRQRDYQLRKMAAGCCQICGQESGGLSRCTLHFIKNNRARREREGLAAWTEGSRGRPPIHKE